jgi:hypothetical protein
MINLDIGVVEVKDGEFDFDEDAVVVSGSRSVWSTGL